MQPDATESFRSPQDAGHRDDHDYEVGSPHLSHPELRNRIVETIRDVIRTQLATKGQARVLEIGAGHGAFTDHVLATGATVTVTEMSSASATLLQRRYAHNPAARVLFDDTGDAAELADEQFDVILCMSVLHHIPDYLAAIENWLQLLTPGGAFLSFQDPLYYPRRSRANLAVDRGAYYVWRVLHGDLVEGVKSYTRRARGQYDEQNVRDMVEYHVLREGVDEQAIAELLRRAFSSVEIINYWSTQSRALQRVGERIALQTTFGVRAEGKRT
jgi:2-polyprenyl-3-methyl-5-hydroxy-6-metoxy-1,4-benzoquinol methylase